MYKTIFVAAAVASLGTSAFVIQQGNIDREVMLSRINKVEARERVLQNRVAALEAKMNEPKTMEKFLGYTVDKSRQIKSSVEKSVGDTMSYVDEYADSIIDIGWIDRTKQLGADASDYVKGLFD